MAPKTTNPTSAPDSPPRKPLLFGDDPLDGDRYDDTNLAVEHWDASYVPGYSELKRENELRVKAGKPKKKIPRLQWVRISSRSGEDVNASDEGMMEWRRLGYRACGLDDLESMGFGMPPTAHVAPDGTIRRQDAALFFVDEERASRNRVRDKIRRDELRETQKTSPDAPQGLEVYRDTRAGAQGHTLEEIKNLDLPHLGA